MKRSVIALTFAAIAATSFFSGEAAATRSARIPAVTGFPTTTQGATTLLDGEACFNTLGNTNSTANAGNGSIYLATTSCLGANFAFWNMPLPTEVRATSTTITGYIVTTGSPYVALTIFSYLGVYVTATPLTLATSPQMPLSQTLPVGGYAVLLAQLYSNQSVVNYAYEYDF